MNCGPPAPDQLLSSGLHSLNWEQSMDPLSSIILQSRVSATPASAVISGAISDFAENFRNSMPANCLMPVHTESGSIERTARYSFFSVGNYVAFSDQLGITETGDLSRVLSSPTRDEELGSGRESSSVTDLASSPGERKGKKRKTVVKNKGKESDLKVKKYRSAETNEEEEQKGETKHGNDNGSKDPEPPITSMSGQGEAKLPIAIALLKELEDRRSARE